MSALEPAVIPAIERIVSQIQPQGGPGANRLVRWPNENIPLSDWGRSSYDGITQAQFVAGVWAIIRDISLNMYKNAMIVHLSTSVEWPIAKTAYGDVTKIKQERLLWDDPKSLWTGS